MYVHEDKHEIWSQNVFQNINIAKKGLILGVQPYLANTLRVQYTSNKSYNNTIRLNIKKVSTMFRLALANGFVGIMLTALVNRCT